MGAPGDRAGEPLREVDRLRSDFLATASHELRTPLATIKGFADLMTRDWARFDDDEKQDFLRRISRAASRLEKLICDLLDFTQLEQGQLKIAVERVRVGDLVADTLRRLEPSLEDHTVEVDVPTGLMVMADAEATSHVLENLLTNAAKFSPEGSTISVRAVRAGRAQHGPLELPADEAKGALHPDGVAITVADQGSGIPEVELDRVFERFYRVGAETNRQSGTGIGLAIVKEFTEAQGGQVWARSTSGRGSEFTVLLPAG